MPPTLNLMPIIVKGLVLEPMGGTSATEMEAGAANHT